jgi:hypothetical protein
MHGMLKGYQMSRSGQEHGFADSTNKGQPAQDLPDLSLFDFIRLNSDGGISEYLSAFADPDSGGGYGDYDGGDFGDVGNFIQTDARVESSRNGPFNGIRGNVPTPSGQYDGEYNGEQYDSGSGNYANGNYANGNVENGNAVTPYSENSNYGENSDGYVPWKDDTKPSRCSALVKFIPASTAVNADGSSTTIPGDLFVGHSTWEDYREMSRIWKVYDMPFCGVKAKEISFSSYPGCVSSTDDWYLTQPTRLMVTETSLNASWGGGRKERKAFVEGNKHHVSSNLI